MFLSLPASHQKQKEREINGTEQASHLCGEQLSLVMYECDLIQVRTSCYAFTKNKMMSVYLGHSQTSGAVTKSDCPRCKGGFLPPLPKKVLYNQTRRH